MASQAWLDSWGVDVDLADLSWCPGRCVNMSAGCGPEPLPLGGFLGTDPSPRLFS